VISESLLVNDVTLKMHVVLRLPNRIEPFRSVLAGVLEEPDASSWHEHARRQFARIRLARGSHRLVFIFAQEERCLGWLRSNDYVSDPPLYTGHERGGSQE